MRNENKLLEDGTYQIMRVDRGDFDLVCDEKGNGWYIETDMGGVAMRSKTYPHMQAADAALAGMVRELKG